ncbi:MAG TPA: mismatch repair protein [Acidobacteriaceae bacterium]|nr:mismatch repair protein [Acidobacteriaceae bacterium]
MAISVSKEEDVPVAGDEPAEEYRRRSAAREADVRRLERLHIRLGNSRLLLATVAVVMAWWAFRSHWISPWWLAAPVVAFAVVAAYHARVLRARRCALRAVAVYERGLARIEDRWMDGGSRGERFRNAQHLYAADLDLFGPGSLFALLSTSRTRMGEDALASWLLSPSQVETIRERQAAVAELRSRLDLREDLEVLGAEDGAGVSPEALLQWAESPAELREEWLRWLAPLLVALAVGATVVWAVWGTYVPLLAVIVMEASLARRLKKRMAAIFSSTEGAFENLDLLSGMLARLEREKFFSTGLQTIQGELTSHAIKGSEAIARLRTVVDLIDSRDNFFVRILDVPLMYSVQVAVKAEAWRRQHGDAVRGWLDATGEMEGLLSLAAYHYEHPADAFPEFVEGTACLQGEALGHPLIAAAKCVHNDVRLDDETRAILVSGSNMSGKSTYLRTVGVNVVLAMAGAPVRAQRLQLTPLHVGASIQVNDSLQEGSSRFYAEITRLRKVYDLAAEWPPVLFLLDELLQGTNSNDRRIGAEGVLRGLLERGAIGILTTHDLALTELSGLPEGALQNMHFQDDLENGRMRFDFRLRAGVITKSNGLELMRSIGLKV